MSGANPGVYKIMLVNPVPVLRAAREHKRAIASFNMQNLEMFSAAITAAVEENAPVIIQATPTAERHAGIEYIVAMARAASEKHRIPIALHADHYKSYDRIVECIEEGYTSVMIDASDLPYEENIELVQRVVAFAHKRGVVVEGELGHVGGVEDDISVDERDALFTDPDRAVEYVKATGIDSFAIAIGTAHGEYKGEPNLDFERLTVIRERLKAEGGAIDVPLVLHGASGVPDWQIREAVSRGITKVNIATELKLPMAAAIKACFDENPRESDPRHYMGNAKKAMTEVVRAKIRVCGGSGLADLIK